MSKLIFKTLLMLLTLFAAVNAQYSVRVHSRHEGIQDLNISRPRIFVVNTGTETIRDFYYYYYFTVENNKVPTIERYYAPNCEIALEDLGNGDYRVKYNYRNVNFRPGDILPDAQGNVVGLRYIDWSPWDKTNDYSFDNSSEFQQTGKIPVFLANGTQISGSAIPNPETPPQPPEIRFSNALYAVYSTEYTDLRDRAVVRGGIVGSLRYAEVGCDAVVNGKLLSGGDIFLRERARINGDVAAIQQIKKQNNTVISGTERSFSEINFPQITSHQVNIGTLDAVIGPNGSGIINPGSYREIIIYANSQVTFKAGVYNVDRFIVEPDVKLIFESQRGKKTDIRVRSECRFGDRTKMQFTGDTIPLSISIYSEQASQFRIGTDAVIYGQITAPKASIVVNSRTTVYGMLMGRQVIIEPNATVCKPAVLMDFWHSEWAYAKTFDPLTFEYKAVVPDTTRTLQFTPYVQDGATVLVNGNTYGNGANVFVGLGGSSTNIIVEVKSPENCGKTEYVINIQRSSSYQIFVNANSPATQGQEDGKSWQSAFKCLQQAIDLAEKEGKEIWVAEGTYYPTFRRDSNDSRSATFLIRPGIKITGGFIGDETQRDSKGSPYRTILSGDLGKNDGTAWPAPQEKLNDNAYHVVTMSGNASIGRIKLEMLTVTGGVADGTGENATGGGILNINCAPILKYLIISKNMADLYGAGIMDKGGIEGLERCLIQRNISKRSGGAGIYTTGGQLLIDASVFDGNIVQDTMNHTGGAALYMKGTRVNIVNSIFTRNSVKKDGGAIYNDSGRVFIESSTFYSNIATNGQSIRNEKGSVTILNSILWNTAGKQEISGNVASVNYTCITGGHVGINNIDQDPRFINPNLPEGNDGVYGTNDDGLQLSGNSPCLNAGAESNVEYDIRLIPRPQRSNVIDLGAYEYNTYSNDGAFLGIITADGEFYGIDEIPVIPFILEERDIPFFAKSRMSRIMRIKMPNNKHTRDRKTGYLNAIWVNKDGSRLSQSTSVRIDLHRVSIDNQNLYFHSNKPVLFVEDDRFQNRDNPHAYIIMAGEEGSLRLTIPSKQ